MENFKANLLVGVMVVSIIVFVVGCILLGNDQSMAIILLTVGSMVVGIISGVYRFSN